VGRVAYSWRIALAVVIVVACTASASASLVDLAVGQWSCTVKDVSSHDFGTFDAKATITRAHKWTIKLSDPPASKQIITLAGSWQLQGTSVLLQFTRPDTSKRRVAGATRRTRAISMFVGKTREGDFAVTWKGDHDVTFRQTASNGSPSVAGGDGDAWVAHCTKVH
jgi:hypothetical protein